MKPYWIAGMLVTGFLAMAVSCGPQHKFCPNEPDMECRFRDDGGGLGGAGGGGFNPCPDGGSQIFEDGGFICK